jgi:hypothetical protein
VWVSSKRRRTSCGPPPSSFFQATKAATLNTQRTTKPRFIEISPERRSQVPEYWLHLIRTYLFG